MITDEEIDGLRKLKTKEDRRKRTENPNPEHVILNKQIPAKLNIFREKRFVWPAQRRIMREILTK